MSQITNTSDLRTLTGNGGGGLVYPAGGNITLVGGAGIAITGQPGAHTITIDATGATASTFVTNSGTATPLAGTLLIVGANSSITTAAAGVGNHAVTVSLDNITNNAVLIGGPTETINNLTLINGQLPIGSTGASPVAGNITSTDGSLTISNGAGTIDLSVNGGGLSWSTVNANTLMLPNHGYSVDSNGGDIDMTLPVTSPAGAIIKIADIGVSNNAWTIKQNAGQVIKSALGITTTVGVAGDLQPAIDKFNSDVNNATITLLCVIANTQWNVEAANCILAPI